MRIFAHVLVALALALAAPGAQVIYDTAPALVWFNGATCPTTWAALTPNQTRAALPDTYRVFRPNGGPTLVLSLAALRAAWTVNGVLRQADLDAALALGTVVSLRPGRAGGVRCTWRPLGGSP